MVVGIRTESYMLIQKELHGWNFSAPLPWVLTKNGSSATQPCRVKWYHTWPRTLFWKPNVPDFLATCQYLPPTHPLAAGGYVGPRGARMFQAFTFTLKLLDIEQNYPSCFFVLFSCGVWDKALRGFMIGKCCWWILILSTYDGWLFNSTENLFNFILLILLIYYFFIFFVKINL